MHTCKKAVLCIAIIFLSMTCMAAAQDRSCEPSLPAQALCEGQQRLCSQHLQPIEGLRPAICSSPPCSIRTALAMTYAGARGETASQMKSALQFYT